jgi:hypothetical protein
MAIDEDALKQFIASLPDLDNEREASPLGEEEFLYVAGVIDAHKVLRGEQPEREGLVKTVREIAQRFRVPHTPEWVSLGPGRGAYCKTCEVMQEEGSVPWHSPTA